MYAASGALLCQDRRAVLMATRPAHSTEGSLLEFPGGKLHQNESPESGLARELSEELNIQCSPCFMRPLTFASRMLPHSDTELLLLLFAVQSWSSSPQPCEGQSLLWLSSDDLRRTHSSNGVLNDGRALASADIGFLPTVANALDSLVSEHDENHR